MFKKWQGGAKKHGGLAKSMTKQIETWGENADKLGRKIDEDLGKPSSLVSSVPEKRKAKENEYKDALYKASGGDLGKPLNSDTSEQEQPVEENSENTKIESSELTIDVENDSLKEALTSYLRQNTEIDNDTLIKLFQVISSASLNSDLATDVLAFGNLEVSRQVKDWVKNHVSVDATIASLKKIAAEYYATHTDEQDVAATLAEIEISEFVGKLFALDRPELNSDITEVLLSAEEKDISVDLSTPGDFSQ